MITQEELKKYLSYDPETGLFTRISCVSGSIKIKTAGWAHHTGYRYITISGRTYGEHKLVWLHESGSMPGKGIEIDHINLNKSDNRIINLRLATTSQNEFNKGIRKDNTSGYKGVVWDKEAGKWRASLSYNKKKVNLGRFENIEDAAEAYRVASRKYHGEFGRIK